jgi:hypothetical protein
MKNRAFVVQSILELTENRAKGAQFVGVPSSRRNSNLKEKRMKHILILILTVFAAGCNSATNAGGGSGTAPQGTTMQGTWTATGNLGSQGGPATYQVKLVSSSCSVTTPVGTFSVQGPVCFTANNNNGEGSISGGSTSSQSAGQGVLIGVTTNPVPTNAAFNLVFVAGAANGNFVEFSGSGTVGDGTLTGTGSCSSATPVCQGVSATFSGTQQ